MDGNDFYSIDRLVEFGVGLAAATQMANAMNLGLQGMQTPGAGRPLQQEPQQFFYYAANNKAQGPIDEADLARLISEKRITGKTYVWAPTMQDWRRAEEVPQVIRAVALAPPPLPASEDEQ